VLSPLSSSPGRQLTGRDRGTRPHSEYVGLCAEFPSLSWQASTANEAVVGIERVVDDVVADMAANGEKL
jgi:hypothetical protein